MILSVNSADRVFCLKPVVKKSDNKNNNALITTSDNSDIKGVPRSYITFKQKEESKINFTEDAEHLLNGAREVAMRYHHTEILPQHIIQASIEETRNNIEALGEETLDTGAFASVSVLSRLANDYAKVNLLSTSENRQFLNLMLDDLEESNKESLNNIHADAEGSVYELNLSTPLEKKLQELEKNMHSVNAYVLLGTAMNTLTAENILYPTEFLGSLISFSAYKSSENVNKNYIKAYDSKAIEVWNKLALGSNMIVTYSDSKEAERITASILKTINRPKYGNFNAKNTSIYVMANNVTDGIVLKELSELKETLPNTRKIVIANLDNLLVNSTSQDELTTFNNLAAIMSSSDDNLKLILFQNDNVYYKLKSEPAMEAVYKNTVTYAIPQIQTYEARAMLNKKMLEDVKTPFTKEAKDRAVFHAANLDGIFPDKAVDLMKRIANYYGNSKKKITAADVDEFAQIGYELFKNKSDQSKMVYDTGKTLESLYGKETTKKDIEAIIRQIKTGKIGTRGIIISSKDNEAGSGRQYTAETIAGEAKIPFVAIDTADFATAERDTSGTVIDSPKNEMSRIFAEAKNAARQNQYKTAIVYINNFEEFAFSSPYLPGYRQAMSQLTNEMQAARQEDVSILVIGSTDEYYAPVIPKFIRGFNQSLSVDSPAFNKRARKEVLTNRINEVGLPLAYNKLEEKDYMLDRLVKLTEYMSFVEIKSLIDKTIQIMYERNKPKASMGEFIEAYLQLATGRTSYPEMPEFNKQATTSHECGHATNLEVMKDLLERKGKPWHQSRDVNFITLDPRGDFLGAVFEGSLGNADYPFEAMFTTLVCCFGGYSCEKLFFGMDGSNGISQDLAQATAAAKRGIEYFGFGHNTGKISNAVKIQSPAFYEKVYKDLDIILENAKSASDLITETFKSFNEWFTNKYSKLIGSNDCMVDGDEFRRSLQNWRKSLSADKKEEINILEDMIMDIIDSSKKGIKYGQLKAIKKAVK